MQTIDADGWLPMGAAPHDGTIIRVKMSIPTRITEHRVSWANTRSGEGYWSSRTIRGAKMFDHNLVGWKHDT